MDEFSRGFSQPEYLHVLLNHWPVMGLLCGLLILALSFFQKSRAASNGGLLLILISALAIYPVSELGEGSRNGLEGSLDETGRAWLHEHEKRAASAAPFYYITAVLALTGLILPKFYPKTAIPLLAGTFFMGCTALATGIWTASAGGKIRHPEFRYSLPPQQTQKER